MSQFLNWCVGALNFIMLSQALCTNSFTFKWLELFPWSNSRTFCQQTCTRNVRASWRKPSIPSHHRPFFIICIRCFFVSFPHIFISITLYFFACSYQHFLNSCGVFKGSLHLWHIWLLNSILNRPPEKVTNLL
jgi:hypothetical protein